MSTSLERHSHLPHGERWTIHFDNASSRRSHERHGNGRMWLIMCKPRAFERSAARGSVHELTPTRKEWEILQTSESIDAAENYRAAYIDRVMSALNTGQLEPYALLGQLKNMRWGFVLSGDTLCCACSTDTAAQGWCHRAWAAEILAWSPSWRVVLDGRVLNPVAGEDPVAYRSSQTQARRNAKATHAQNIISQMGLFDAQRIAQTIKKKHQHRRAA